MLQKWLQVTQVLSLLEKALKKRIDSMHTLPADSTTFQQNTELKTLQRRKYVIGNLN
jgi:hypothetical protein